MGESVDANAGRRARTVDRFISFSDGVVAVAITLLALPLVSTLPKQGQTPLEVVSANIGPIVVFLFTFAVVAIMWSAHNRVVNGLRDYDPTVFWLNTAWLALIVLLPWISDMFGDSDVLRSGAGAPGAGLLYWTVLAVLSLLGWLMARHLSRHPELQLAGDRVPGSWRGLVFAGAFLVIGVASMVAPQVAVWLPLGIIPLSIWLRSGPGVNRPDAPGQSSPRQLEES